MKFSKSFAVLCLIICLFTMASACAVEANDSAITAINPEANLEINEDNSLIGTEIVADDSIDRDSSDEFKKDNIDVSALENTGFDELGAYDENLIGADLKANVIPINVSVKDNTLFVIDCADDFNGNISIKVADNLLYDGSVNALIKANKLPAGNYAATAVFYGDSNYEDLTLTGINFTISKVTPSIDVVLDDVTYPRPAVAIINLGNNANGTVNVTVDGKKFKKEVSNGEVSVELNGLSAGYKEAIIEFFSDDDYNNDVNAHAKFIVYPNNSLVEIKSSQTYHVGASIEMEIKTHNSTGDLNLYLNGDLYRQLNYGEGPVHIVDFGELAEGSYTVTATLDGDENYTGYSTSATFNVVKNDLTIDLNDVGDICVDRPATFTATLNESVTGDVIFTINGINYTAYADNENTVIYTYVPVNNETLNIVARFMGNDKYNVNVSALKQFNVERISTNVEVSFDSPIIAGDDAVINVLINPEITCTVELIVNGKSYDVAIVEGSGKYSVSNLANAIYDVKAIFAGDERYGESTSEVKQLFVNKVHTNLDISIDKTSMSYYDFAVVSVVLDQSINNVVTLKVNGRNHTVGLVNGKGSFTLYDLDKGNYTINAVFAGDDKYVNSTSDALNLTVTGDNITSSVSVSLDASSEFVGDEVVIRINSNPTVTGIVKLNVGSNSYDVAVNRGVGTLTISDLPVGTYDVQAVFEGDNHHIGNSSDVKSLEIKRIPTTLSISVDNSSVYVGDSVVVGTVLDKSINNVVTISVNDKDYLVGIVNGKGNLTLSGLAFGTYTVNATFAGEDKYLESSSNNLTFEVNKIKTQLTGNAVTTIYDIDKNLVITLNDLKGNAIGNVDVTVDLNGAKTLKTDSKGQVKVSTNGLAPNVYSSKIIFNGNAIYDTSSKEVKVTVNKATPKITANAKKFKIKDKTKKYTVTLKTHKNEVMKNTYLTITVNKKTYSAKTNSKGVATFKLKKLTKKGKYSAIVKYGGSKYYNAKSVNVKITVK